MGYPIQLKKAVIEKVLQGNKQYHEIAIEFGVGRSTIGKWLKEYKQNGNINLKQKEKRPKDWTAEEHMSALIETVSMNANDCAAWCRKKGIFSHNLDQWKNDALSAMTPQATKAQTEKEKKYRKEIASLKKDLNRKDKALAETAALLVLKKKSRRSGGSQRTIDQSGSKTNSVETNHTSL